MTGVKQSPGETLPDGVASPLDWEQYLFLVQSDFVDDGIYTRIQIYNLLSSCNVDIQAGPVFGDNLLSGNHLKQQKRKVEVDKVLEKDTLKEKVAPFHRVGLTCLQAGQLERDS